MNTPVDVEVVWKLLDRPLWVVTAGCHPNRGGLIATWITQSSLSPQKPQVTAGIAPNHHTCKLIDEYGAFGLHLLRQSQLGLIERFAGASGRDRDKLDGLALASSRPAPILADCAAWMTCQVFARLDAGDRVYFWADVIAGGADANSADQVARESHVASLPPTLLEHLRADRERDIQIQAPMASQWRAALPDLLQP